MTFYRNLFALFFLSICMACQQESNLSKTDDIFFDIPAYFNTEAERLTNIAGLKVKKTVLLDGTSETKELFIKDWNKELTLFSKIQIHRPTQREKYTVDSSFDASKNLKTITYTTTDKKTLAKNVLLEFQNNQLTKMEIKTHSENEVYDAVQTMTYLPSSGFFIQKEQTVTLLSQHNYEVNLSFIQ